MGEGFESFYEGGASSLSPDYGNFVGYRLNPSQLGFHASPQTADQLSETIKGIKQGTKAFEIEMLSPEVAQAIPKQHFKEIRALMKLSGVKPSFHGPVIDAAGFGQQGWGGETQREEVEREMLDAVEKAKELDPKGNIPVVFHASNGAPGSVWRKEGDKVIKEVGHAVDRETGRVIPLKLEHKYRPYIPESLKGKGIEYGIDNQIASVNETEWEEKITSMATFSKHADDILGASTRMFLADYKDAVILNGKIVDAKTGKELPKLSPEQAAEYEKLRKADIFLDNVQLNFHSLFDKAYKYGTLEQKEELRKLSEDYSKKFREIQEVAQLKNGEVVKVPKIWGPIRKKEILDEAIKRLAEITEHKAPEIYVDAEKFAMEKAVKTFSNVAFKAYEKFGKNAPILAIENLWDNFAFGRTKDLKKLVRKTRESFAKYLVEKKNLSPEEAKRTAEKYIGVTWDVGHLNLMRKRGFSEKDIVEATKEIAPLVKHVHLTDNFGFNDSHLPPGMGNVPFKKILKELEKTGRLDEMRKIVEAGNFVQHFKRSPHPMSLAAFGSGIYGMKMAPYWNQVSGLFGSYFAGYGPTNPELHHQMYGAGFTSLPMEFGGNIPGMQSRFSGTPMA